MKLESLSKEIDYKNFISLLEKICNFASNFGIEKLFPDQEELKWIISVTWNASVHLANEKKNIFYTQKNIFSLFQNCFFLCDFVNEKDLSVLILKQRSLLMSIIVSVEDSEKENAVGLDKSVLKNALKNLEICKQITTQISNFKNSSSVKNNKNLGEKKFSDKNKNENISSENNNILDNQDIHKDKTESDGDDIITKKNFSFDINSSIKIDNFQVDNKVAYFLWFFQIKINVLLLSPKQNILEILEKEEPHFISFSESPLKISLLLRICHLLELNRQFDLSVLVLEKCLSLSDSDNEQALKIIQSIIYIKEKLSDDQSLLEDYKVYLFYFIFILFFIIFFFILFYFLIYFLFYFLFYFF